MFAEKDALVITAPHLLEHLTPVPGQVVVLNGDIGPINSHQEEALCTFVERGGGLVCTGDAAEAYHEYDLLGEVLGNIQRDERYAKLRTISVDVLLTLFSTVVPAGERGE